MKYLQTFHRKIRGLNQITLNCFVSLAMLLVAVMTIIVLTQVFFRYFLANALPWPEELSRFLMVWLTFLIIPYAYSKELNVGVDMVLARVVGNVRRLILFATHLLVALCGLVFLFQGYEMMLRGFSIRASSMDVKLVYVYCIIPVSFFALFNVAVEKILDIVMVRRSETSASKSL